MVQNNKFELLKNTDIVHVFISEKENSAVQIAVQNLLRDIQCVCGCEVILSKDIDKCKIIIGTIENNKTITEIIKNKKLSVEKLKRENGFFHWEAFLQEVVDDVFYIIGTDRRGTIFGIYDLCESIGVSPWYYWADVPVKKKEKFCIAKDFAKVDWPSIKYRGIFLNDEEELNNWAKLHTSDDTIGPATYKNVFELLLRLKANYIWPAMHVNCFNENPENGALAERMGIVVGTSHCDMLLRSNQNEWAPWIESKGFNDAVYDYSIKGRNREILKEYWQESVEKNKNYEVCYTMGMRGIHDSGFITCEIDNDISMNEEEKKVAKINLLGKVIKDQQQIIKDVLGEKKEKDTMKTFIPYKEVLSLYDSGIELPDDVTLIWANDNFGYMRRYPNEKEQKRSGGNGLYYHCSYWANPGTGMSYLFINSIPLAHIGNELKKSYESGIRKLWILNVGGLKPLEQDMEFFLKYGWEAGKEKGITKDTLEFTKHWIDSNFSGNHGVEVAKLYEIFAQVTNVRKVEHMKSNAFSQTIYGDEAGRRLMKLEDIFRRGNVILNSLPKEEQDAFFQLFLMKIHASYYTNHEFYYADRSVLSFNRGNMQAADRYVELSVRMMNNKRRMLHFYNKKMSSGKWDEILTPEKFPPPPTAMYPERKPALKIEGSSIRVDLWNEEDTLKFSIYGRRQKWIDIGNQGEGNVSFNIDVKEGADWISISQVEGIIQTEKRILVSVINPKEHAGMKGLIIINDLRNGTAIPVKVQVEKDILLPNNYAGYIEADGYISMEAAQYDKNNFCYSTKSKKEGCGWITVPGIGRYEGAAMMTWNSKLYPMDGNIKNNPCLEYEIYLNESGSFTLEIYRFLTLNSKGRIRLGIGIDDDEPIILESDIYDEWKGEWQECIMDNGEKLNMKLPRISAGTHNLKVYMIDNYVTISKLVIYTSKKKTSNLGPITSKHNNIDVIEYGMEGPNVDWEGLEQICNEVYITKEEEVPLPNVLYATREFFKVEQLFQVCLNYHQTILGEKRYEELWRVNGKKNIINEFGTGMFVERDGVLAIEAEYALKNSKNAYLTPSKDGRDILWSHLQAETNGRTGFAMHVAKPDIFWEEPENSPGMHYKLEISNAGIYHVWMLIRHHNGKSDSCYLSIDGEVRPLVEQFGKGNLHTYNTAQVYYWCLLSDIELSIGEHLFSILARRSQLRIDRIYLTSGEELPPIDADWKDSIRK
ncbi:glycosyl hydrolase 115 family protein [Clostridium sp. SHJSY1]|uniref:glycosyl hydrolase 115 family protein n=1 Tax=Clostridium sp. SHJSY1 TaxID=2942483 RepID=UPI002874F7AD|nr:glycosyl hydrolase 115 family protein [Clostridium sp. SHJSY1]MDS0526326.1 glycosyl hydrolase 115 family protein [Clostridium sp. SHJSY1]